MGEGQNISDEKEACVPYEIRIERGFPLPKGKKRTVRMNIST